MSKIQPIRGNVLVKCFESDAISSGGIHVPESFREESNKVEVVAVGNGVKNKPMRLKPGMVGYRVKNWGIKIIDVDQSYYLMDQDAILALDN